MCEVSCVKSSSTPLEAASPFSYACKKVREKKKETGGEINLVVTHAGLRNITVLASKWITNNGRKFRQFGIHEVLVEIIRHRVASDENTFDFIVPSFNSAHRAIKPSFRWYYTA
jgi:hypothetical protein